MSEKFLYEVLQLFILPIILAVIKTVINVIGNYYFKKKKIGNIANNKERIFITKCDNKKLEIIVINVTVLISLYIYSCLAFNRVYKINTFVMLGIVILEVVGLFIFSDTEAMSFS